MEEEYSASEERESATRFRPVTIVNAKEPKRLELKIEVPVEDMARLGAASKSCQAAPPRKARNALPSGARSIPGCSKSSAPAPRRSSSSTTAAPRNASPARSTNSPARPSPAPITARSPPRSAPKLKNCSRPAASKPSSRPRRSNSASIWARSTSSFRSRRRPRSPAACSASAAPATTSAQPAKASSSPNTAPTSSPAPPSLAPCTRVSSSPPAFSAIPSMCSRSKWSPSSRSRLRKQRKTQTLRTADASPRSASRNSSKSSAAPPLRRAQPHRLRRRPRPSRRPLPLRRIRRAAPAHHLGPRPQHHHAAPGLKLLAIVNGGTIPDRGLYGVFLAGSQASPSASANSTKRWSSRAAPETPSSSAPPPGASTRSPTTACSSRPRPASPARCPSGTATPPDARSNSAAASARSIREIRELPHNAAISRLTREHDLDPAAAENLIRFLADQELATVTVPDDRNIVIERCRDELGDWRVCVLTPFGSRIHAPWAMAVTGRIRADGGPDVETMWADDGFVLRFPGHR